MRTNIVIDNKLLQQALKLSGLKTKKDVVHEALSEYVTNLSRKNLADLEGKELLLDDYDYKLTRGGNCDGASGYIGVSGISAKNLERKDSTI